MKARSSVDKFVCLYIFQTDYLQRKPIELHNYGLQGHVDRILFGKQRLRGMSRNKYLKF